jgi:hypothetical protein
MKTDKRSLHKNSNPREGKAELVQKAIPFITDLDSRLPSADRYVVDVKSLLSYFTNATIPENFPMYNPSRSFLKNKKIAIKYLKRNSELLRDEVKEKLYSSNSK